MFKPTLFLFLLAALLLISPGGGLAVQNSASFYSLPEGQQFSNLGRQVVAISPDGSQLVYVANNRLYAKPMAAGVARMIPGIESEQNVTNPVFSPDGKSVAYWSSAGQELRRILIAGGTPQTICRATNPFGMSWSVDGSIVFGQGANTIQRVAANGGTPETLVTVAAGEEVVHGPQLLPGGDTLLFTLGSREAAFQALPEQLRALVTPAIALQSFPTVWDTARIVAQSLKTKERKVLITGGSDARYESGQLVYANAGKVLSVPFDVTRLEVTGKPVTRVESVRNAGSNTGTTQFSSSANGTLVYLTVDGSTGTSQRQLSYVGFDGKVTPIRPVPPSTFGPRISPDGKQVAYRAESSVWIADLTSSAPARRLSSAEPGEAPVWSPDGQQITFISILNGNEALFMRRADGTGPAELLADRARAPESWSSVHQSISYITLVGPSGDQGDYDIWTYSFKEKKASPLIAIPPSAQSGSRFSPDGRWIAYESNESGRAEVYVEPFPRTGQRHQISRNGGSRPVFFPDGSRLFFDNNAGPAVQLYSTNLRTQPEFTFTEPAPLPITGFTQPMGTYRRQWDITPDGTRFIATFTGATVQPRIEIVSNWLKN